MVGTEDEVRRAGAIAAELAWVKEHLKGDPKEEREREELLYKRAVLEVVKELNEKYRVAMEKIAKAALVDLA